MMDDGCWLEHRRALTNIQHLTSHICSDWLSLLPFTFLLLPYYFDFGDQLHLRSDVERADFNRRRRVRLRY